MSNYFADLENRYRITEEAYQRLKLENKELYRELFPPITFDPLSILFTDNSGQKLYREAGRLAEVTPDLISLGKTVFVRNY